MPIALTTTAVRIEFRTAVGGSPSPARNLAHDKVSPLVEGPAPQALAAPSSANRWPLGRGARRPASSPVGAATGASSDAGLARRLPARFIALVLATGLIPPSFPDEETTAPLPAA